jgi:uncharacterized protein YcbX
MTTINTQCGSIVALWRYPVKSMMGENLNAISFGSDGVIGDRAYAVIDPETGKVASAKNPKKWPNLFDCHATYLDDPSHNSLAPVRVMLPNGAVVRSDDSEVDSALSAMLGRTGALQSTVPEQAQLEEYWPDMAELDHQDTVTDEAMPPGTFFDVGPVHLLTTGTLDALRAAYPTGRWETRRFRPNVVIDTPPDSDAFPEAGWIEHTIALGDDVRLKVTMPCGRCVMTTLPQGDLPRDPGILRAAAQTNQAHVGVYAEVLQGGLVRRGDPVTLA